MINKRDFISASLMCAPINNIKNTLDILTNYEIDYLHVDVMDGNFISNLGLGTDYIKSIRKISDIPMDYHMMVVKPEEKISWFPIHENDHVCIHYESTYNLNIALNEVGKTGANKFVALNPGTPISAVESVLEDIDGVTILTVNPGFAGQKIIQSCIDKTWRMRDYLDRNGYPDMPIEVDGNISLENAQKLKKYGANIFVAGTSCLFNHNDIEDNLRNLSKILSRESSF